MNSADALQQRLQIAEQLAAGYTPSQVAKRLDISRTTVYKVIRLLNAGEQLTDGRSSNLGKPTQYSDIWELIRQLREQKSFGPVMLYHTLKSNGDKYGLTIKDIPSPATIGRWIHTQGLATAPVGPNSRRVFPDAHPVVPHEAWTIDLWGPWHVRASKIYLITLQDRFSRLFVAWPVVAGVQQSLKSLSAAQWGYAFEFAGQHFGIPGPVKLYLDNGVGGVPSFGFLPSLVNRALSVGAEVTYIPPAEPWRNGRLERVHWSMEREYWRQEAHSSTKEALSGLADYINWHNTERPHTALRYQSPVSRAPWIPITDFTLNNPKPQPDQVKGLITAIRLVDNKGIFNLWQRDDVLLTKTLAGHYIRMTFGIDQSLNWPQVASIVYNRSKEEPIPVAYAMHSLGDPNRSARNPIVHDLAFVDMAPDEEPSGNQRVNDMQYDAMRERILKRRRVTPDEPNREEATTKNPVSGN